MIRAVIFDLGHTIWDIGPQDEAVDRAYAAMRETLGVRLGRDDMPSAASLRDSVRSVLEEAGPTYFMDGTHLEQPPSSTWLDAGCRRLGLILDGHLLRELTPPLFSTEAEALICGEGTLEAVQELADAGYLIGCVTNTLADGAAIAAMLRRHGFAALMRSVVVSADEGWRKPHPSLFEKAMGQLGVSPAEAVFVGDSPVHDIAGAQAVGMRAVITQQYAARDYERHGVLPDAVVHHLRELQGVIARFDLDEDGLAQLRRSR